MDVKRISHQHTVFLTAALYELRCHTKLSCIATEHHLWQTANFSTKLENRHFDSWIFSLLPSFLRPGGCHWEGNLLLEGVSLGCNSWTGWLWKHTGCWVSEFCRHWAPLRLRSSALMNNSAAPLVTVVVVVVVVGCGVTPVWERRRRQRTLYTSVSSALPLSFTGRGSSGAVCLYARERERGEGER